MLEEEEEDEEEGTMMIVARRQLEVVIASKGIRAAPEGRADSAVAPAVAEEEQVTLEEGAEMIVTMIVTEIMTEGLSYPVQGMPTLMTT